MPVQMRLIGVEVALLWRDRQRDGSYLYDAHVTLYENGVVRILGSDGEMYMTHISQVAIRMPAAATAANFPPEPGQSANDYKHDFMDF